jgi:hypothetical protein
MNFYLIMGTGLLSFALAFVVHVIIWRLFKPARQILLLVLIFLVIPILLYLMFSATLLIGNSGGDRPLHLDFSLLWHLALSSAYIMTYPPIQTGCPSLNIIFAARRARGGGMSEEEIHALFTPQALLSDRIRELGGDGLIRLQDSAWGLTFTGRTVRMIFGAYRNLLGLPFGEG